MDINFISRKCKNCGEVYPETEYLSINTFGMPAYQIYTQNCSIRRSDYCLCDKCLLEFIPKIYLYLPYPEYVEEETRMAWLRKIAGYSVKRLIRLENKFCKKLKRLEKFEATVDDNMPR